MLASHPFRRLVVAAWIVVAGALALPALAQAPYPSRPITLVVPYPPGGSADVLARALGQKLGERLGQTVVVDNRAGAATAIGARAVAGAAPDGYTLLMGTVTSHAINPAMNKVGYDPVTAFTPIAPLASIPFVFVAHPSLPVTSVADVIALTKTKPEPLAYASAGPGTSNHLAGEVFAAQAGIKLLHVPYKGSAPALNDVLAGHVPLMFDLQATALPHIQGGKLKAIAVTGTQRSSLLPNVPTMVEAGVPNYEVSAWFGLFAPAGLPRPLLDRLSNEVATIFRSAEMRKQMLDLGAEPVYAGPDAYAAFVKSEAAKWGQTVKAAGLGQ